MEKEQQVAVQAQVEEIVDAAAVAQTEPTNPVSEAPAG